jgi:hypothetical protein
MFRQLARWLQDQAALAGSPPAQQQEAPLTVFRFHPLQLTRFLEEAWFVRNLPPSGRPSLALDDPAIPPPATGGPIAPLVGPPSQLSTQLQSFIENWVFGVPNTIYPLGRRVNTGFWDHLIYAYIIENTHIYEIARRVLYEYAHGEKLDVPSAVSQHWLRATEDLFYKDAPPFTIQSLSSHIRPDIAASRRNAYWRMFGMDLNHGIKDGQPYPYEKPEAHNRDFVPTFENLLREVWRGGENFNNAIGPNSTDNGAIANLAQHLFHMFAARRRNGNLSREEYFFVVTMSWLHLTVEFDSPIVVDLKATASSPEERLRLIGERVGTPAHSKSESYFRMAEPLSRILSLLETGLFNTPAGAVTLYARPAAPATNPIAEDMLTIITHWSIATGRDVKSALVRAPATQPATTNGQVKPPAAPIPAS